MTITMMVVLQKIFLITVPLSTILTTIAMLLPYWWSSETIQIGLWRARSFTSPWVLVEPQTDTQEGRLVFALQILSFISVLLSDLAGLIWLISLIRQFHSSFISILILLITTIFTSLCLSTMIFIVWHTAKQNVNIIQVSYSFYLTSSIILLHSMTLTSLSINLAHYQFSHRSIQPFLSTKKTIMAFEEPNIV